MGNCCFPVRFLKRSSVANPKEVTLLLAGLDNSGKTTVAKRLSEEPLDDVLPTVGFSKVSLEEKGCRITIYDLGGGPQIRDIWPRYYPDVHGVIFVMDASDTCRISECKKALEGLLMDSYISGKPILLLANKQDVEGALDEIDIVDRLNLEYLVNQQKCPTLVELCSARHFSAKMDIGIDNGYKWLLRSISKDYPVLNNRVLKDIATQEELERIERAQKEERIRKARQRKELGKETENGEKTQRGLSLQDRNPFQNGIVRMVDGADAADRDRDTRRDAGNAEKSNAAKSPNPNACGRESFKREGNESDFMLIKSMSESRGNKNFLKRPKSSGPRLSSTRSDPANGKGPRRKTYKRHNKTAPSPVDDPAPKAVGPLPKVFDPTYYTDVGPYDEPEESDAWVKADAEEAAKAEAVTRAEKQRVSSASETHPRNKELAQSSNSAPSSRRETSAAEGSRKFTPGDAANGLPAKCAQIPTSRPRTVPVSREIILHVTNLNN